MACATALASAALTGVDPAEAADPPPAAVTQAPFTVQAGPVFAGTTLNVQVTGVGGVPASGVGAVALNVTATGASAGTYLTVFPTGSPVPYASNLNVTAGVTVPNMVVVPVGTGGQISIFNAAGSANVVVDVLGWFPTGGSFNGLTPARLLDTRIGGSTIDGYFTSGGALPAGSQGTFTVVGRGGVPLSGVGSVALNVTATGASAGTYLTVFPTGSPVPYASNLNVLAGATVPNMVVVPVGTNGQISIFNAAGNVDVIVDVLGWFPAGGSFVGLTPARLVDTRPQLGGLSLRTDGIGVVPFGASAAAVEAAVNPILGPPTYRRQTPANVCPYGGYDYIGWGNFVVAVGTGRGLEGYRLSQTLGNSAPADLRTPEGIGLGTPLSAVLAVYPTATVFWQSEFQNWSVYVRPVRYSIWLTGPSGTSTVKDLFLGYPTCA
jgi:hypothetical protein